MNVLELAGRHVTLRRSASTRGGEYTGACPGCGDGGKGAASDRFHVWPEEREGKGSYWCRQCGKAGDAIQFLIDFEGKSFAEACAHLGIEAGAHPVAPRSARPLRTAAEAFRPKANGSPRAIWQEKARALVAESRQNLCNQPAVLKYLAERGIDAETIERFAIGWIEADMFRPRESWGLEPALKSDGTPKKLFIPRGILIPSIHRDAVYHLQVRRPRADVDAAKGQKKYFIVPGSAAGPLVAGDAQSRAWVVVETKLDAALIHRFAGDLVGVMAMVSSSNKPDERSHQLLTRAACILVSLDFDQAGKNGFKFWKQTYPEAERWPVPLCKDPGEAFAHGLDIRAWILAGLPPAWHVGPAPMQPRGHKPAGTGPGAAKAAAATDSSPGLDGPTAEPAPSVKALGEILNRYPVRIRATDQRTTLLPAAGFKNEAVLKRASGLVFFDAACWRYLHDHPEDIIDRDNFAAGAGFPLAGE